MDKVSKYGNEVRQGICSGIDKLVNPVKITLGAKGRLIGIYDSRTGLHVTKDGYTTSKNIQVQSNKLETIGIEMVMEAIKNTNTVVGDATTTTAIMCQYLIREGSKLINNRNFFNLWTKQGKDPLPIIQGLQKGLDFVKSEIELASEKVPVDGIKKIASISGNNREDIGDIINEAFTTAGIHENSSIKIFETTDEKTTVDILNGYKIEKGFLRESFINHASRVKCVYHNPYIITVHAKLTSFRDFIPLLKQAQEKKRPLVIIADKFEGEFLNSLEVTLDSQLHQLQRQGGSGYFQQIGVVQNPMAFQSAKELYDDMKMVTGSKTSSLSVIINDIDIDNLGGAEEVEINRTRTLIIGGHGRKEDISNKIKNLEAQKKDDKDLTDFQKDVLKIRIESLSGSHANIRVGGQSPTEIKEAKDLFDDALNAVRASLKEGIVAGGGSMLLRIAESMKIHRVFACNKKEILGWNLIIGAIEAPFYQVMDNARERRPKRIAKNILKSDFGYGYNVLTKEYVNMIDEGIIDPAMAERVALENAVAVAIIVYNMDAVVIEDLS